ncbi:GTPase [Nanoarchaeota archaeon]
MPINASPHFDRAQVEYEQAQTTEQKIKCLKKMIALAPKHKGAENLNAQLKKRLAKLKYAKEKEDKSGKSSFKGIKKADMQSVILGYTNSGKSSLLSLLSHAHPKIAIPKFTTKETIIGMMNYHDTQIQLIENPAIESEYYDKGLTNSADTLILIVIELEQIQAILKNLEKAKGKIIIVFNKIDKLTDKEKRKISATLSSKKHNFVLISTKTKEGIEKLKEKIFQSFDKLRVYTKEPGKEKSNRPIILNPGATVKEVAEKILHGFSKNVKETKIWGPSSKFPAQKVGLKHVLKDKDIVEFKTK